MFHWDIYSSRVFKDVGWCYHLPGWNRRYLHPGSNRNDFLFNVLSNRSENCKIFLKFISNGTRMVQKQQKLKDLITKLCDKARLQWTSVALLQQTHSILITANSPASSKNLHIFWKAFHIHAMSGCTDALFDLQPNQQWIWWCNMNSFAMADTLDRFQRWGQGQAPKI